MSELDAVAPQGETTPSTTNTEAPIAEASAAEQAPAEAFPFSADEAKEIANFLNNHGGLAKVRETVTKRLSNMASAQPQPEQSPSTPAPVAEAQPAPQPVKVAAGYITPQEVMSKLYNKELSENPEYASIKEDILKGTYLQEMASMGITPVDAQGNMNDDAINKYLTLKAKTVPAPVPSDPVTSTPTKQYTTIEGDLSSFNQALSIVQEGAGHPRYAEAKQYISNHLNPTQPEKK